MASATTEIVARLQLRAEQFSSENGRAFAEMATRAKAAATDVRTSFSQSYAEVQRLAERSLKAPRTAAGALDLSSEIASLRASATAAEQNAVVTRELGEAMQRTAITANGASEAMLREADAAMVASRASDADAKAIRERILALEVVQVELNRTTSATAGHNRAANDDAVVMDGVAKHSGNAATAKMLLQHSIRSTTDSFAAGLPPAMIFGEQIGRLSEAAALAGGSLGKVGAFMGGPWGIAVSIGLSVLAPFVGKLLEGNDALGDSVEKLKKDAEQTDATRHAKELFANTADGVAAAIRDGTDATRKSIEASKDSAEQANIEAKNFLEKEVAIRKTALAYLEQAKAQSEIAGSTSSTEVQALYLKRQAGLQQKVDEQRGLIAQAEARVQQTRIDLAAESAKRATDPMARIKKLYDDQARAAQNAARAEAARGKEVDATLTRQLAGIEKARAADIKAEQDRQSAAKKASNDNRQTGRPITSSEAAAIVRGIGGQVNSADRSYAQQAALYTAWINAGKPANNPVAKPGTSAHEMGNAIDVQMGNGMTPAKLRAAFQAEGVQLTKVFAEQGHWHIEWTKSGAAAHELAQGIRDAEQEQRKLDAAMDDVLTKFDPAAEAARKYRKELGEIDALVKAGKLTPDQATQIKFQPVVAETQQRTQSQLDAMLDQSNASWEEWQKAQKDAQTKSVDAWMSAADSFRRGADTLTQLLGIRVSGPLQSLLQPGGVEGQSHGVAKVLVESFGRGLKLDDATIEKWTAKVGTVIGNASYGQIGGSVFSSITGGKGSKLGSSLGGVVGGELGKLAGPALGKALGSVVGPALGKSLGSLAGPLGAIAGGVLGSVIGGLFKKKSPSGSVDITGTDKSGATASGKLGSALTGDAANVQKSLTQIAQQLGAVTGAFSVSIGRSGDWFHVAGQAGADVSAAHPKSALIYEGKDEAAAVQAAILNALQDGAIKGISEASQRILKSGQDLDTALTKALAIEAVPRDLKAMLDPVGAAIDELNRKWKTTVDALKEGGASAEQMAQAERLYNLQLDQTKNSTSSASQALKDFMTSLKLGSSSPYSLRDQEGTARTQLQPYLDQITAGQSIDQSKYQSAANAFLDIERQLYGSTQAYFDALDTVQATTNKAISTIDNAEPITTAVADPFTKATAESAAKTATGVQTSNELLSQLSDQMGSLQQTLAALGGSGSGSGGGGGGSTFIGSPRLFGLAS